MARPEPRRSIVPHAHPRQVAIVEVVIETPEEGDQLALLDVRAPGRGVLGRGEAVDPENVGAETGHRE